MIYHITRLQRVAYTCIDLNYPGSFLEVKSQHGLTPSKTRRPACSYHEGHGRHGSPRCVTMPRSRAAVQRLQVESLNLLPVIQNPQNPQNHVGVHKPKTHHTAGQSFPRRLPFTEPELTIQIQGFSQSTRKGISRLGNTMRI